MGSGSMPAVGKNFSQLIQILNIKFFQKSKNSNKSLLDEIYWLLKDFRTEDDDGNGCLRWTSDGRRRRSCAARSARAERRTDRKTPADWCPSNCGRDSEVSTRNTRRRERRRRPVAADRAPAARACNAGRWCTSAAALATRNRRRPAPPERCCARSCRRTSPSRTRRKWSFRRPDRTCTDVRPDRDNRIPPKKQNKFQP